MSGPQSHSAPKSYDRARGVAGARARWGPPRVVRLEDLTDPERQLVVALIEAAKNRAAKAEPVAAELTKGSVGGGPASVDDTRPAKQGANPRNLIDQTVDEGVRLAAAAECDYPPKKVAR